MIEEELHKPHNVNGVLSTTHHTKEYSEVVQDIINAKSGFIERWGLLVCLFILLVLVCCAWFIQYPDVIKTRAGLTAANAPKEIVARQEGRLVKICVHNNGRVEPGSIIGWVESTASHAEVIRLSAALDSSAQWLVDKDIMKVANVFRKHYHDLGELQLGYQQFVTAWQSFNDYLVNGFYEKKKDLLQKDIYSLDSIRKALLIRQELTTQKLQLAEESYGMNRSLLDEKVLSKEEFRIQKGNYLTSEMAVPELTSSLLLNGTQKREKLKELNQLEHDIAQQASVFQQALHSFRSEVNNWMNRYVLRSPVAGRVFFVIPVQENQFIRAGTLLGYINPDDSKYYMETYLEQQNFGKIDTGMKVLIRFDAYPYQETGTVAGTLDYISEVPSDSGFLATIRLNKGLMTDEGKRIPFKNGLKAEVLIITRDMRLLERLYARMKLLKQY